jgi:preprotein translocase subunit SecE
MSEQEKMTQEAEAEEKTAQVDKQPKAASKPKKDKAKAEKKPGAGKRFGRFFRELKAELKKVSWPSRADTIKKTGIVIACVIVVGVIVWIFDGIASGVVDALISLLGQ